MKLGAVSEETTAFGTVLQLVRRLTKLFKALRSTVVDIDAMGQAKTCTAGVSELSPSVIIMFLIRGYLAVWCALHGWHE